MTVPLLVSIVVSESIQTWNSVINQLSRSTVMFKEM